ncbi:MAG: hypothetical protein KC478_17065 [Bacteriovoracaceae bacterium]|nr:hypothetical protein [Bacteriovoracaceae bacterium]
MGPDTGPEGNAMRMDEKKDFDKVVAAFDKYIELNKKNKLTADEIHALFKDTNLIAEKASYPSLFKLKNPLYLIEDRAQEALRSYEEFYLVSNMRLKIFESFFDDKDPEKLESFSDLHGVCLTSFWLWKNFKAWSDDLGLDTAQYKRFFDRQFPILSSGVNVPQNVSVKEGRRPRVIKDITKRGDTIVSKTIDTSFKRIEIFCSNEYEIDIQAQGIEFISAPIAVEDQNLIYRYLDIKMQDNAPVVEVNLLKNDDVQEKGKFNLKDMMWV